MLAVACFAAEAAAQDCPVPSASQCTDINYQRSDCFKTAWYWWCSQYMQASYQSQWQALPDQGTRHMVPDQGVTRETPGTEVPAKNAPAPLGGAAASSSGSFASWVYPERYDPSWNAI